MHAQSHSDILYQMLTLICFQNLAEEVLPIYIHALAT
jgi:hypothetical protein